MYIHTFFLVLVDAPIAWLYELMKHWLQLLQEYQRADRKSKATVTYKGYIQYCKARGMLGIAYDLYTAALEKGK